MANVFELSAATIKGDVRSFAPTRKLLLVVNVASKCGAHPTIRWAQKLRALRRERARRARVSTNEFGAQEPGTNEEIQTFCTSKYGVKFDMFAKVVVKGDGIDPLFAHLTGDPKFGGDIHWNFNKFLIGKDGTILARFGPQVDPMSAEVTAAIEKALG
jgi:glutathione peroxidase